MADRSSENYPIGKKKAYLNKVCRFIKQNNLSKTEQYLAGLSSDKERFNWLLDFRDNFINDVDPLIVLKNLFENELNNPGRAQDDIAELFNENLHQAFDTHSFYFGTFGEFNKFANQISGYTHGEHGDKKDKKLNTLEEIFPIPERFKKGLFKKRLRANLELIEVLQELSQYKGNLSSTLPTLIENPKTGGRDSKYSIRRHVVRQYWNDHDDRILKEANGNNQEAVRIIEDELERSVDHVSNRTIKTWIGLNR